MTPPRRHPLRHRRRPMPGSVHANTRDALHEAAGCARCDGGRRPILAIGGLHKAVGCPDALIVEEAGIRHCSLGPPDRHRGRRLAPYARCA
jgi:hypothetical protein